MAKEKKRPATQKTTLRLPVELWKKASHRAIDEGVTLQVLVERAIDAYLRNPLKEDGR